MNKKILGLVLELNPFHLGHDYFISQAKLKLNPDLTIAVISSSFTMRGDAMVMDKFFKAKLMMEYGIDIVMELPFVAAVNSSDLFTYNAISILINMGMTHFAFGGEINNIDILRQMNEISSTSEFNRLVKNFMDNGFSYSTSCYKTLQLLTDDINIIANYTLPNNMLGMGYIRAIDKLKKEIEISLIERIGNNYYDTNIQNNNFNSATSLRESITKQNDITDFIPKYEYSFCNPKIMNQNLFIMLQYYLSVNDDITGLWGINEGIDKRLKNIIYQYDNFNDYISYAQTKRYSKNRIQRLILHILLQTSKKWENKSIDYLRILSMNDKGQKHLNTLPKDIKKQIITSFKNIDNEIVSIELQTTKLWGIIAGKPLIYLEEYNVPFRKKD